jgi:1-aminocyclopropane-1-carboxylate deaminase
LNRSPGKTDLSLPDDPRLPKKPEYLTVDRTPWSTSPRVFSVRGDRLHPIISGNKWFKLRPWLIQAHRQDVRRLVSVGGAYSNHLHALAYAGHVLGIGTAALVRGPEPEHWSATLADCNRWGMTLTFIDRDHYRLRGTEAFARWACEASDRSLFIPEGGWSACAIEASAHWWRLTGADLDALICPVGSGTTLAGLARSAPANTRVIGVPVYRDPDGYMQLRNQLTQAGVAPDQYDLWTGYAGRGFGRLDVRQRAFMSDFEHREELQLDPVYTAKTFHALHQRLALDSALSLQRLGILHTGGLQGRRG